VTSLPALAIDPSDSALEEISPRISLWVERADPKVLALIGEAMGSEASIVEVDVGELPRLLSVSRGPTVLVCDTRRAELARTVAAVAGHPAPVPVVALCADDSQAVSAHLRAGAYDCLTLAVSKNLLAASIRRAAAHHQLMNEYHELEQHTHDELEPKRKQKTDAGKQLPNTRWLHNVLPLDPSTKTSEHNSLSLGVGDSDVDHDVVEPSLSPEQHLRQGHRLGEAKADFERRYLQAALAKCRGNLAAAARCSGMDRSNFRRLLKRYGLHPGSVERS